MAFFFPFNCTFFLVDSGIVGEVLTAGANLGLLLVPQARLAAILLAGVILVPTFCFPAVGLGLFGMFRFGRFAGIFVMGAVGVCFRGIIARAPVLCSAR